MTLPMPPQEFMNAVSGTTVTPELHRLVGEVLFGAIRDVCQVKPTDAILDIGCGCGRIAQPFTQYLTTGTHEGFDIVLPMIKWCQENITGAYPNFRFKHAHIRNTLYSEQGQDAAQFVFPYGDNSFDVAFATSVFTHLLPASARQYAKEITRVLKKDGGRALLSFFLIDDDYRTRMRRGDKVLMEFAHQMDGYSVADPSNPEMVVAFDTPDAKAILEAGGLRIDGLSIGQWNGNRSAWMYQDAFLVSPGLIDQPASA
jgi:ubiquinone/menaquinone biosynthesis C-methylase UbiE